MSCYCCLRFVESFLQFAAYSILAFLFYFLDFLGGVDVIRVIFDDCALRLICFHVAHQLRCRGGLLGRDVGVVFHPYVRAPAPQKGGVS